MAFLQYLIFNNESLPLPLTYDVELTDVEADTSGETEAGTLQRDLIRRGIVNISVSFQVSALWLKKLSSYKRLATLNVKYLDTETLELREAEMYMESFSSSLKKDTSGKGLWTVSFTLKEF